MKDVLEPLFNSCASARVEVFICGVQKGGTTSLHTCLSTHPELISPSVKETHFFDNETFNWRRPDYDLLHAFYPSDRASGRAFEATPIYVFWPPAIQRIHDYNPSARLIVLLRDPILRAWSHWRMERARGRESLSFSEAVRGGRDRMQSSNPLGREWRIFSYVERGFYADQIRRLLGVFSRDQVLFVRSADFLANQEITLRQVAQFLNAEPFPVLAPARKYQGRDMGEIPDADFSYLRTLFYDQVSDLGALADVDVSDWPTFSGRP